MTSPTITVLIEGGPQLHEFRHFSLRSVVGFDPRFTGGRCLRGAYLRTHGSRVPPMNVATAYSLPPGALLYLHAKHTGGDHIHAALAYEPGAQVEVRLTTVTAERLADRARLERLLLAAKFVFARTMAATNPHEYSLRKTWDDADFQFAVLAIRRLGYRRKFGKGWYTQLDLAGFTYWTMGWPVNHPDGSACTILINRKEQPGSFEPRDQIFRADHARRIAIPNADAFTGVSPEFTECPYWRFGAATFGVERDPRPRLRKRRLA